MNKVKVRCGKWAWRLAFVLCYGTVAVTAYGQGLGGLFDGSYDPTNRNNNLGFHVETPFRPPVRRQPQATSGLAVMTYGVDHDGWILESSRSDRPMVRTNRRAEKRFHEDGHAYWWFDGKEYRADPKYDDPVRHQNFKNRLLAERRRRDEEQQRVIARSKLAEKSNNLLSIPTQKIAQDLSMMNDQVLDNTLQQMAVMIREAKGLGLQDERGFERVQAMAAREYDSRFERRMVLERQRQMQLAQMQQVMPHPAKPVLGPADEEHYAANLGIIYVAVRLPNGNFGAKVTRVPPPNAPASQIGLEPGDIVVELDGQPIRSEADVINHVARTTVRLINVRTGQPQDGVIEIP